MDAWHKGRQFIDLIEYKRTLIDMKMVKVERLISQTKRLLNQQIHEYNLIRQKINSLTPSGVLEKSKIHQGIRCQGVLLSRQQLIIIKINQLEEENITQEKTLQNFQIQKGFLEKKYFKVTRDLYRRYNDYTIRSDENSEDDALETICYGKSKF
ncbi:hypothetical protein [Erwinia pyrifoliae]|uniref:Type III secretion system protein n=1 Tax=Erwinia pyrifoliae TaxID=79967 RepID=A0ABY5XE11_ERWPY|nr:hypothetical protein [Erwinia pyrifoliae]AUX72537.1 type III secretion system protein [Erwinia pyrifoliae]MCT2387392.1 type III secretion system protein [Erwinia pyrifoliae]MCU8587008.1 type III secretion system protein [Erwinia pyrifoliae]UWS30875.1 type III secretion system protein [Erwinia pyrifoliae]UWS35327.1 type III secretion system protein [Erwinia pyrifoliae]